MPDPAEVSFTVKELLQEINRRLESFMVLLGNKADQSSVAHLAERIDGHENRLADLEHEEMAKAKFSSAAREFRRWIVPTVISLVTAAVLIVQVFHL